MNLEIGKIYKATYYGKTGHIPEDKNMEVECDVMMNEMGELKIVKRNDGSLFSFVTSDISYDM